MPPDTVRPLLLLTTAAFPLKIAPFRYITPSILQASLFLARFLLSHVSLTLYFGLLLSDVADLPMVYHQWRHMVFLTGGPVFSLPPLRVVSIVPSVSFGTRGSGPVDKLLITLRWM